MLIGLCGAEIVSKKSVGASQVRGPAAPAPLQLTNKQPLRGKHFLLGT